MDTDLGINITANASGVGPGVQRAENELVDLKQILEQLTSSFSHLATEMRQSMDQGAQSANHMERELRQVDQQADRTGASLQNMANKANLGGGALGYMKNMAGGFIATLATGAAFEIITSWSTAAADAAEHTEHLAEQFGMTTTQIQQLNAIALTTNISVETMTKAMGVLDKNLFAAGSSSKGAGSLLKQMGLSAEDAKDQMKIMLTVADKFAEMEDGPKKAAMAMQLFGRAGREMIPILNLGSKGIEELNQKAQEYNVANTAISESAQEKASALDNVLDEQALAYAGLGNILADAFLPMLTKMAESMNVAIKAFNDSYESGGLVAQTFNTIKIVIEGVGTVIDSLIEIFGALWGAVSDVVGSIVGAIFDGFGGSVPSNMSIATVSMNLFRDAIVILKDIILIVVAIIKGALMILIEVLKMVAKIAWDAFTLNWGAIVDDWNNGLNTIKKNALKTASEIKSAYDELAKTMANAVHGKGPPEKAGGGGLPSVGGGGGGFNPSMGGGGGGDKNKEDKKPKSRVSEWEAKLDEQRVAQMAMADQQGTFQELSKKSEAEYWKGILDTMTLTHEERLAVEKKYYGLRSGIRKLEFDSTMDLLEKELVLVKGDMAARQQIAAQMLAMTIEKYGQQSKEADKARDRIVDITRDMVAQISTIHQNAADAYADMQEDLIMMDEEAAQHRVDMGQETDLQLLEQEREFEVRRRDIRVAALRQQQAILDPARDPVKYAQISQQIEQVERQHQMRMTGISNQEEQKRTAGRRAAISEVSSLWAANISKMLTLQQSFGESVRSIYMGMVGMIANALEKIIQRWIEQHLAALIMKRSTEAVEGVAAVTTNAAVAGSAAFASIAAIPIVGPAMAPAAGAAAFAGAMAFAPLASARGGWDRVPTDGAMSMLHLDEMVLPASIASPLRSMISDWGAGPTGQAAQQAVPASWRAADRANDEKNPEGGDTHFHIHAMDTKSGARWLMDNRGAVARSMKQAYQDGHR